ncbi:MAG: hypothetical protein HOG49_17730 [Candidatus Scalindua sp.]|jgi:hypothetical protein|nr:hypothetical protein [Candidatus Scalindua sp.]
MEYPKTELLNAVIQIREVGLEDKRLKVISEEGKVYSIWKTKKDGTETMAYTAFKDKALSATGMTVEIGYDERPNPQSAGTFFRAIKTIKPSTGAPQVLAPNGNPPNLTTDGATKLHNLEVLVKSLELRVSILEGKNGITTTEAPKNATWGNSGASTAPPAQTPPPSINENGQEENAVRTEDIPF